jgi:single-strand DNA-binding protein
MSDINVVVLIGRLTRDSELKYTKSGMPLSRFSIAVNRSRKQDDQWVDEASFFEIDYYGKGAESFNKYLTKGKQVCVEGELRQDRWEQDGQPRSKVLVIAGSVQLLSSPQGGGQGGSSYPRPQQTAQNNENPGDPRDKGYNSQVQKVVDTFEDDIPF